MIIKNKRKLSQLMYMAVLSLFAMTLFSSCGANDDDTENSGESELNDLESMLVGKWTMYTIEDSDGFGRYDLSFLDGRGYYELRSDHTGICRFANGDVQWSGVWRTEIINDEVIFYFNVTDVDDKWAEEYYPYSDYPSKAAMKKHFTGITIECEILDIFKNYLRLYVYKMRYVDGTPPLSGDFTIEWKK